MTDVNTDLIRDLLREQHPDLAELPLQEVTGGWGNQMWRLGDDLAVRAQRMDTSPDPQLNERRWLPQLAARLPLPIPTPVRNGTPTDRFPKLWTVMTWVHGTPADHAPITHGADSLAEFLRALHTEAPDDAPDRPSGFNTGFEDFLAAVDLDAPTERAVRAVWDDLKTTPAWTGPRLWVHGDLHPANAVTTDGALTGIIDFGALAAGDPAWDLTAAWLLLPDGHAARFLTAYGQADDTTIRRARGLAAMKSLFLILMGQNGTRGLPGGKPHWEPVGHAALGRVLRDFSGARP